MSDAEEKAYAMVAGEVIEWQRNERGLSQRGLSEESGVPQSTISRIERGEVLPDTMTLKRLAAGLGISLQELTDDIEFAWSSAGKATQAVRGGDGLSAWWIPVMGVVGAAALIAGAVALALDSRPKRG